MREQWFFSSSIASFPVDVAVGGWREGRQACGAEMVRYRYPFGQIVNAVPRPTVQYWIGLSVAYSQIKCKLADVVVVDDNNNNRISPSYKVKIINNKIRQQ